MAKFRAISHGIRDGKEELEIAPGKFILITPKIRDKARESLIKDHAKRLCCVEGGTRKHSRLILEEAADVFADLGINEAVRLTGVPAPAIYAHIKRRRSAEGLPSIRRGQTYRLKPASAAVAAAPPARSPTGEPDTPKTPKKRDKPRESRGDAPFQLPPNTPRRRPDTRRKWRGVTERYLAPENPAPWAGASKVPLPSVQRDPLWLQPPGRRGLRGAGV